MQDNKIETYIKNLYRSNNKYLTQSSLIKRALIYKQSLNNKLYLLNDFSQSLEYLTLNIASPYKIKNWATKYLPNGVRIGEVKYSFNLKKKVDKQGLFSQQIFGPIKNWLCACKKYKGSKLGILCPNCKVEITSSRIRRYNMGYIELFYPVAHIWYSIGIWSYIYNFIKLAISFAYAKDVKDTREYLTRNDEKIELKKIKTRKKLKKLKLKIADVGDIQMLMSKKAKKNTNELIKSNPEQFWEIVLKKEENKEFQNLILSSEELKRRQEFLIKMKWRKKKKLPIKELEKNIPDPHFELYFGLYRKILNLEYQFSWMYKFFQGLFFEKGNIMSESIGTEMFRGILCDINLNLVSITLRKELLEFSDIPSELIFKVRMIENFLATKTRPEWMILTRLPIVPPAIRPFFTLGNNTLQVAPLNKFYDNILNVNNFLISQKILNKLEEVSLYPSFRFLQNYTNQLFDNARLPEEDQLIANNRPLTSLTENLEGKFGRFRYTLLGKRVNFSARSVIVVGPTLTINQCGLPYEIAIKLFEPYLIQILALKFSKVFKISSNSAITEWSEFFFKPQLSIWILLKYILSDYSVMLNRAPTLHKFGIQTFRPLLILGKAITLHPLVCTGFNADFDGDQMAVHLPLYSASQIESFLLTNPSNNILTPASGDVIVKPSQDIVIGSCYLSLLVEKKRNLYFKYFLNKKHVIFSYYQKEIDLHTPILIQADINLLQIINNKNKIQIAIPFIETSFTKIEIYNFMIYYNMLYILSNFGIIIAKKTEKKTYKLYNFFLKTTPGRLIFNETINFLTLK